MAQKKKTGFQLHPEHINRTGANRGSGSKRTIFREIADLALNTDDDTKIIESLTVRFPEFFANEKRKTLSLERLAVMRLMYEAINGDNPIAYLREMFDRLYGKSTTTITRSGMEEEEDDLPGVVIIELPDNGRGRP